MDRFDDKRINEALELLNEVARDKKTELQAAVTHKYTDLASAMSGFTDQAKEGAMERFDAGKQQVLTVATDIDKSVHRNPWVLIGGTAVAVLLCGFLLGRSHRA